MPASYPGAVKTFVTRSAGQTIEPSHVNDLQDEVNAIEAGLRNGTAPLNSSGSTMVTLSVTGGSTLVNVTVVNLTASGSVNLQGTSTLTNLQATNSTAVNQTVTNLTVTGSVNLQGTSTAQSLMLSSAITLLAEVSTVVVPAAGGATLYLKDNGSGKTQLLVQFGSGAAVQIAIEP